MRRCFFLGVALILSDAGCSGENDEVAFPWTVGTSVVSPVTSARLDHVAGELAIAEPTLHGDLGDILGFEAANDEIFGEGWTSTDYSQVGLYASTTSWSTMVLLDVVGGMFELVPGEAYAAGTAAPASSETHPLQGTLLGCSGPAGPEYEFDAFAERFELVALEELSPGATRYEFEGVFRVQQAGGIAEQRAAGSFVARVK